MSFKFASELNNGDELLTLGYGKTLDITETLVAERQKGLFAPFTAEGNFYIFPK